ncbi:MAG: hypothetical protein ACRC62_11955 [Microcoleus sp.]
MIKPCSQPLKTNPFTSYRDSVTGKWVVVNTVENDREPNSSFKRQGNSAEDTTAEPIPQSQPAILHAPKHFSFPLTPFKKLDRKSAVNVRS